MLVTYSAQDISWASVVVDRVRAQAFPELQGANIRLRPLRSESDYFRARFAIAPFLLGRPMRYLVFVNPEVQVKKAPAAAIDAIVAHELEHIVRYRRGSRLRLLGLVRLLSGKYTARFERDADRRTIGRGYRQGLAEYREWLYANIPPASVAAKKRNYLTPDEIRALPPKP